MALLQPPQVFAEHLLRDRPAPAPVAHGLAGETAGKRVLERGSSPGEAVDGLGAESR